MAPPWGNPQSAELYPACLINSINPPGTAAVSLKTGIVARKLAGMPSRIVLPRDNERHQLLPNGGP